MSISSIAWSLVLVLIGTWANAQDAAVLVSDDGTTASITIDGIPRLTYRHAEVPFKPYVRTFRTLGGSNILRDRPADHIHHHALMFAVEVDGVNFWAEFPDQPQGSQVTKSIALTTQATGNLGATGTLRTRIDWIAPDAAQTRLLTEDRTVILHASDDLAVSLLTWKTRLAIAEGRDNATLSGHHYYGLGMRLIEPMDGTGEFLYAAGEPGPIYRGQERLTRSKWVAYTAPVEDKTVTVAMFDAPTNPRHPATMFTMPVKFAYLSATLNLEKEPLVIEAGRPLCVTYGVALWESAVTADEVEHVYRRWVVLARSDD